MANTRTILNGINTCFLSIGKYMCSPIIWACGGYDDSNDCFTKDLSKHAPNESAAVMGVVIGASFDSSIGVCKFCIRLPCCCVGSAITIPTGIVAASALGVFGCVGASCASVADIPEHCAPQPNTKPSSLSNSMKR